MNQRCFPPWKSMLGGPPKETRFDEGPERNHMEMSGKRRGRSIATHPLPSFKQFDRQQLFTDPHDEDLRQENDVKRPRMDRVLNVIDLLRETRPEAYKDNDVISEAHHFLDVDIFAVGPGKLPVLLAEMLEMERCLDQVVTKKLDIKEKMVKIYEQESANTRSCLEELEKTLDCVSAVSPGAALQQRRRLQDARVAFMKIDLSHKVPATTWPVENQAAKETSFTATCGFKTPNRLGRPISRGSPFPPMPQIGSNQLHVDHSSSNLSFAPLSSSGSSPSIELQDLFALPPPPLPPPNLLDVDFSVPPPNLERGPTLALPIQLPDFSRPPPLIGDQSSPTMTPRHQVRNDAQNFLTINLNPIKGPLTPLMEMKTRNFVPSFKQNRTRRFGASGRRMY